MPQYTTHSIRTIALVGHGEAGKTTLAEALLHQAGAIKSKGAVEKGNTVCDFDTQEKAVGHSLQSAIVHFEYEGARIHLIDTPGYPDFAGQAIAALEAVAMPSRAGPSPAYSFLPWKKAYTRRWKEASWRASR